MELENFTDDNIAFNSWELSLKSKSFVCIISMGVTHDVNIFNGNLIYVSNAQ